MTFLIFAVLRENEQWCRKQQQKTNYIYLKTNQDNKNFRE